MEEKTSGGKPAEPTYNKTKLWILKTYLSAKGWLRHLWFKKNRRYYGGRNKRYGVYMGKRTFYETFEVSGYGYCYYDSKPIKYEWWELGLFPWKNSTRNKNGLKCFCIFVKNLKNDDL